jgi:hypothetical protein
VSIAAITEGRGLLAEPDPVPELTKQLATALRLALGKLQDDLAAAFSKGEAKLAASPVWAGRTDEQRATIATACQLITAPKAAIGTEDEILAALRARSLARPPQPAGRRAAALRPCAGRGGQAGHPRRRARAAAGGRHQDHRRTGPVAGRRAPAGGRPKLKQRPGDPVSSLPTPLRRQLESAVRKARKIAEAGARHALEALAVHEPDPYQHMDEAQRRLRRSCAPRPGNWAMARAARNPAPTRSSTSPRSSPTTSGTGCCSPAICWRTTCSSRPSMAWPCRWTIARNSRPRRA